MNRTLTAFAIAPLASPALIAAYVGVGNTSDGAMVLSLEISTVFAYVGALFIGLPIFLFFRKRGWTAFWIAPVLGFVIGSVAWIAFAVLFPLVLGTGMEGVRRSLSDPA